MESQSESKSLRKMIDLRSWFKAVLSGWWIVALCAIVSGVLGLAISFFQTPMYESATTLYVTTPSDTNAAVAAYQGSLASQQRVSSYAKLVTSDVILADALERSGLGISVEDAADLVKARASVNTVLLTITARMTDPVQASNLANSVAESLRDYVKQLELPDGGRVALAKLTIVSPAVPSDRAATPNIPRNVAAAIVIGGIFGALVALLRARLDVKIRDGDSLAALVDAPVLSAVPSERALAEDYVLDFSHVSSPASEAFRRLRANLSFVSVDSPARKIVVASAGPSEGKSTVSLNLAAALAESGATVVLVDADLRRPTVASRLMLNGAVGVTDVLAGALDLNAVMQSSRVPSLDVVSSGSEAPNPVELLGSNRTRILLDTLAERYDYVIVDVPPVNPVTDAAVISQYADGVLLVARAGVTSAPALAETISQLRTANVTVLGAVLNGFSESSSSYSGGYYGYVGAPDGQRVEGAVGAASINISTER